MLDSSGNQLWTWDEHQIHQAVGFRSDGFCLSPDGHVGHVGGVLEPDSVGMIDPNGNTLWQAANAYYNASGHGLTFPCFDEDLNLYAVVAEKLVSYDSSGVFRFAVDVPYASSYEGVRCNGTVIYLRSNGTPQISSYDQSGSQIGSKTYSGVEPFNQTFGVNSDGNALFPRLDNTPNPDVYYVDVLDETCSVIDSIEFTGNVGSSVIGVGPQFSGWGLNSSGKLFVSGIQSPNYYSFRATIYNITDDTLAFYSLPISNNAFSVSEYRPDNTSFDDDGHIYVVKKRVYGSGVLTVDGMTILKFTETGTQELDIRETSPQHNLLSSSVYNAVQVEAISGRILVGSGYHRAIDGYTVS